MPNRMRRAAPADELREKFQAESPHMEPTAEPEPDGDCSIKKSLGENEEWVIKSEEKRIVGGLVLQPGIVDAQGDIISAEEIEKAAHSFLARFNRTSKLGLQHSIFDQSFDLLESSILKTTQKIGGNEFKKGTWFMVVRVKNEKIWKKIKQGKIRGFSIAGKAKTKKKAA